MYIDQRNFLFLFLCEITSLLLFHASMQQEWQIKMYEKKREQKTWLKKNPIQSSL